MNLNNKEDYLKKYLKEIDNYKTLTKEEEQFYANDYFNNGNMLSRKKLIDSNYRLVIWCIKSFYNIPPWLDIMDVIQSGNVGFITAIDKFDPSKGFKLSTYAVSFIKYEINKFISEQYSSLNIGTEYFNLLKKYNKLKEVYLSSNGKKLSDDIVLSALSISKKQLTILKTINLKQVSLDSPISSSENDDYDILYEIISDCNISIEHDYEKKELTRLLIILLDSIGKRSSDILKMRYAIYPYNIEHTYKEIGIKHNISKQRVAKIIDDAIKECRDSEKSFLLENYIDSKLIKRKNIRKRIQN